jgi:hypothetical protein
MNMFQMPNQMAMGRMIVMQEDAIKRILKGDSLAEAMAAIRVNLATVEAGQILDQLFRKSVPDVAAVKDALKNLQALSQTNPAALMDCISVQSVLEYYLKAKEQPGEGEKTTSQPAASGQDQPKKG